MKDLFYNNVEKRIKFINELMSNRGIKIERYKLPLKAGKNLINHAMEMPFPQTLIEFYRSINGFYIKWNSQEDVVPDIQGVVNILPMEDLLKSWKNVVYFNENDDMKNFVPIDFFIDEACVGAFVGEDVQESLYFYDFRSEPLRLHIDLLGYFELVFYSKGYLYWQYVLKSIIEKVDNSVADQFENDMPKLFPDFNFSDFIDLYKKLKIKL